MFWRWQQISDTSVSLRVRVLGPQEPEVVLEDGRARCECSDSWQVSDVPQMVLNVHKLELEGRPIWWKTTKRQSATMTPGSNSAGAFAKLRFRPGGDLGVVPCVKQDEVPISRMHLRKPGLWADHVIEVLAPGSPWRTRQGLPVELVTTRLFSGPSASRGCVCVNEETKSA